MRTGHVLVAAITALAGVGLCSCSAEEAGDVLAEPSDRSASDAGFVDTGGGGAGDTGSTDTSLPPEEEEFELQPPRASRSFVFVANTTLNSVAKVDSLTLSVTPIEVCIEPTEVQTLPTMDRAVVLCRGDDQIAVIDAEGGDDDVRFAPISENANRLLLAPNGDFALAWFDERLAEPGDDPGNPHDLTLLALGEPGDTPDSYLLSVGFGIRSLQFDDLGETAFVTTEDGLNIFRLEAIDRDQFLPLVSIGEDPLSRAQDREVLVSGDGELAFIRSSTFSGIRVLDVATEELADVALPAVPTDLDLFPDGERAIAVLRDVSSVALLPLPEAVDDPDAIELIEIADQTVGLAQLTGTGQEVLLYSTATPSTTLAVLDLESGAQTVFPLRKMVAGVRLAPAANRAIVLHVAEAGEPVPGEPVEDYVAKSYGYSLFDVPTGTVRLVISPTDPDDIVFTEDGTQAFIMLEDASRGVQAVQWVDFTSFRVDTLEMARPPESIGVVPASGRVYVSQLAETGRITFIDTQTGRQQHVTAYQLNRRIE